MKIKNEMPIAEMPKSEKYYSLQIFNSYKKKEYISAFKKRPDLRQLISILKKKFPYLCSKN